MRKHNIDLTGLPNIMTADIKQRVANRTHPMASLPFYSKAGEPSQYFEEKLIGDRFRDLCNSYARTFGSPDVMAINSMEVMMGAGAHAMVAQELEQNSRGRLKKLAEKIIREQFNVARDEVIFDLELVDIGNCQLPDECNKDKDVPFDFEQTKDLDLLKKRTINALSQGGALKSHYLFHMYRDEIEAISPELPDAYQKALISNDLFYFALPDGMLSKSLKEGNTENNAGYVRLNFDGKVPKIEAKAINFPILIHEMTKGLITLFSVPGIQNMTQEQVDEVDYIMAELYEIRFGAILWQEFHNTIDVDDYDIKKLIIMKIFSMDAEDFHAFMGHVINNPEKAQREVKSIVRTIRQNIMNYEFEKNRDRHEDDEEAY